MSITLSCGHKANSKFEYEVLNVREMNSKGNRAVSTGSYCLTCAAALYDDGLVIETDVQFVEWLGIDHESA